MNKNILNLGYVFISMSVYVYLFHDTAEDIIQSSTNMDNFLGSLLYLIFKPLGIPITNIILFLIGIVLLIIKRYFRRVGSKGR